VAICSGAVFKFFGVIWVAAEKANNSVVVRLTFVGTPMFKVDFGGAAGYGSTNCAVGEIKVTEGAEGAVNLGRRPARVLLVAVENPLVVDLPLNCGRRLATAE